MSDLWPLEPLVAGLGVMVVAIRLVRRARRRRLAGMVQAIQARGGITLAVDEDGSPICPHCGHTLRSER